MTELSKTSEPVGTAMSQPGFRAFGRVIGINRSHHLIPYLCPEGHGLLTPTWDATDDSVTLSCQRIRHFSSFSARERPCDYTEVLDPAEVPEVGTCKLCAVGAHRNDGRAWEA